MASLKELFKGKLTPNQLSVLPSGFDVVGDILIFSDFPEKLVPKGKLIAQVILKQFPNIKVVCRKARKYSGSFRTPTLRILGGERRKETTHRENNIRVKLHIENVYFSPRLATERERINKLVRSGEEILVMFSGCGVYPINIAKNTGAKEIYGVEINPIAHRYALENLKLNKIQNVTLLQGDVQNVLPKISKKFDRILMPLPKSAEEFLAVALSKLKKGGILHFYTFAKEDQTETATEHLKMICKKFKRTLHVLSITRCGQYSPGTFRVCVDAKID